MKNSAMLLGDFMKEVNKVPFLYFSRAIINNQYVERFMTTHMSEDKVSSSITNQFFLPHMASKLLSRPH
jgi:hypothetical protein